MRIAIVLTPPSEENFRRFAQVGVTDFVCRYPAHYGLDPIDGLTQMRAQAAQAGLRLSVVEGYLPIDQIVLGRDGRDRQIEEVCRIIAHMGKLGVEVLCYNFMHADWTRTDTHVKGRGGAVTNSFDANKLGGRVLPEDRCVRDPGRLWENLAYMMARLIPAAESGGVKLAMHPDDPPLPSLLGGAQVMHNPDAFARLFDQFPSEVNGMCFCQGTFSEMGVDVPANIRRFAKRIHYVHFRDVRGRPEGFVETFHDEGQTDMAAAMRAYREIGFRGAMRPDHVPRLEGEPGDGSGYSMLGRLFVVGYMRGLMHATG